MSLKPTFIEKNDPLPIDYNTKNPFIMHEQPYPVVRLFHVPVVMIQHPLEKITAIKLETPEYRAVEPRVIRGFYLEKTTGLTGKTTEQGRYHDRTIHRELKTYKYLRTLYDIKEINEAIFKFLGMKPTYQLNGKTYPYIWHERINPPPKREADRRPWTRDLLILYPYDWSYKDRIEARFKEAFTPRNVDKLFNDSRTRFPRHPRFKEMRIYEDLLNWRIGKQASQLQTFLTHKLGSFVMVMPNIMGIGVPDPTYEVHARSVPKAKAGTIRRDLESMGYEVHMIPDDYLGEGEKLMIFKRYKNWKERPQPETPTKEVNPLNPIILNQPK